MAEKHEFTKYERARILGARSLQISMDAPLLLKIDEKELRGVNFDPLKIAEMEIDAGVLPITVKKPLPQRGDEKQIERVKIEESTVSDEKKMQEEAEAEREIMESGEMNALNESEDEAEEKVQLSAPMDDMVEPKLEE
jgi:DNA-directed RNA polymerase subunit K